MSIDGWECQVMGVAGDGLLQMLDLKYGRRKKKKPEHMLGESLHLQAVRYNTEPVDQS